MAAGTPQQSMRRHLLSLSVTGLVLLAGTLRVARGK
jgi:hypothetical protein